MCIQVEEIRIVALGVGSKPPREVLHNVRARRNLVVVTPIILKHCNVWAHVAVLGFARQNVDLLHQTNLLIRNLLRSSTSK